MVPTAEKLLKYLKGRKRPVTVAQLAEHFLISPHTIRSALSDLKSKDLADFEADTGKAGRPLQRWFYRRPLALSSVSSIPAPAPHRPRPPRKWTVYDERAYN